MFEVPDSLQANDRSWSPTDHRVAPTGEEKMTPKVLSAATAVSSAITPPAEFCV
ncbi:MAG TPA: hypothetical protein VJ417_04385 [Candidatus Glassbacteria bacterium]|nr:hypothetical protein [Candidatus Glassbacteria bacterium]